MNPCTACQERPVALPGATLCLTCFARFKSIDEKAASPEGIRKDMLEVDCPLKPTVWVSE